MQVPRIRTTTLACLRPSAISAPSFFAIVIAESAVSRLRPDKVCAEDPALPCGVRSQIPLGAEHVDSIENVSHESLKGVVAVAARHRDVRLPERRFEVSEPDSPDLHRNGLKDTIASFTKLIDAGVLNPWSLGLVKEVHSDVTPGGRSPPTRR